MPSVKEVIAVLETYPQHADVLIADHEFLNVCEVHRIAKITACGADGRIVREAIAFSPEYPFPDSSTPIPNPTFTKSPTDMEQ